MRSFLGLLNFHPKFASDLASCVAPLNDSLKKTAPDKPLWTSEMSLCFENAKSLILNSSSSYIPQKGGKFILQTDACDIGIGAVLWQVINDVHRSIAYISRKSNMQELNYAVIEKECLAIKWELNV